MTRIVGHRGGRDLWPENSLTGFRNLLNVPVDAVEFDVHLSDFGELLVVHDAFLDRTTETAGPVRMLSPKLRRSIRLEDSSDHVPTLEEVLEIYAESPFELHVELKPDERGRPYPGLIEKAAAVLARFGLEERSLLTSFNLDVLSEIKRVAPSARRLCSVNARSAEAPGLEETLRSAAEHAHVVAVQKDLFAPEWDLTTRLIPLERLGVWVPNTREELAHWLQRRPGFLTTDDPVLAVAVRAEHDREQLRGSRPCP